MIIFYISQLMCFFLSRLSAYFTLSLHLLVIFFSLSLLLVNITSPIPIEIFASPRQYHFDYPFCKLCHASPCLFTFLSISLFLFFPQYYSPCTDCLLHLMVTLILIIALLCTLLLVMIALVFPLFWWFWNNSIDIKTFDKGSTSKIIKYQNVWITLHITCKNEGLPSISTKNHN